MSVVLSVGALCAQAASENELHDQVEQSLVKLSATGIASVGPQISDPVTTVGTGFLIGEGGYILTTAHLFEPLKKVFAVDTKITAEVSGMPNDLEVLYISELASLDLVLLRAFKPRGFEFPPPLAIGNSEDVPLQDDPDLLTSGWDDINYLRDRLGFNTTTTTLVPYAWTLRGNVQGGQSGSPVYIDRDGEPLVVGVLKATARNNRTLALMIPIENSFQLIGRFKMREMQTEIARLNRIIGLMEGAAGRPLVAQVGDVRASIDRLMQVIGHLSEDTIPQASLFERVDYVEESVKEVAGTFEWSAKTEEKDGSIVVAYEKLISGEPQLDKVHLKITPVIFVADDSGGRREKRGQAMPTWAARSADVKQPLDVSGKRAEFVFHGIQEELTENVMKLDGTFKDQTPYKQLKLTIRGETEGGIIAKDLFLVPTFSWSFED